MSNKMTKMEEYLRLVVTYLRMNDEGRNMLDMIIQKLSEINNCIYEEAEEKK